MDTLRVYRQVLQVLQVLQVFDDETLARAWLASPVQALAGERPLDLFDTFEGRNLIRATLRNKNITLVGGNGDPGFRIELQQKDLNLALAGARSLGISLPNTATAQELFNSCATHGGLAWDHSAMCQALEMMADHEIAQVWVHLLERPDDPAFDTQSLAVHGTVAGQVNGAIE